MLLLVSLLLKQVLLIDAMAECSHNCPISIIQQLHLDSPRTRRTRRLERVLRLLQREAVRDKRLKIYETLLHERYCLWVLFVVPELEADVDFPEGGVHERIRLEAFAADTDDEYAAAEACGLRCQSTHVRQSSEERRRT